MTTTFKECLDQLETQARDANRAEAQHQQEAARRTAELRMAREFAWRRLNLLRSLAATVRPEAEEEPALAAGRTALLREAGLNGATQAQRDLADRFAPVTRAVWQATREDADPSTINAVLPVLADFEAWHAADRGTPFLGLMERDIPELPLVEV
ncbi:hypothetical protein [Phaeovulum sp.]|uniref:hypothetical protein n=1 Tax=Phaeovulum sp. TaxID=2934796 RepID=UPI0039E26340